MKNILIISLIIMITACKTETILLKVKHYQSPCIGANKQELCLNVLYQDSTEWEFFYGNIEGFDYKMGYEYELEVSKEKIENTPVDALSYNYKLEKIISKTPNYKLFTIPIRYDQTMQFIKSDTLGNYQLCNQLDITFESKDLILEWDSIQNINTMQQATFGIDTTNSTLILKSF